MAVDGSGEGPPSASPLFPARTGRVDVDLRRHAGSPGEAWKQGRTPSMCFACEGSMRPSSKSAQPWLRALDGSKPRCRADRFRTCLAHPARRGAGLDPLAGDASADDLPGQGGERTLRTFTLRGRYRLNRSRAPPGRAGLPRRNSCIQCRTWGSGHPSRYPSQHAAGHRQIGEISILHSV